MNFSLKKIFFLFFVISMLTNLVVMAAKITGDTSPSEGVSIQTTSYNFDGNSAPVGANGAVWFKAGFTLDDINDTEIGVPFPVSGAIAMNSGVLSLQSDLALSSTGSITGTGSIKGNGNTLYLGTDLTYTGSNTLTIADSTGDICTIDGGGRHLVIDSNATLSVAAGQTLVLRDMELTIKGTLSMTATSILVLNNVIMHLDDDFTFSSGTISVFGDCRIDSATSKTFTFSSAGNLAIQEASVLMLMNGLTYKHSGTGSFSLAAGTARLFLIGATFEAADKAVSIIEGQLWVDHYSYLKSSGGRESVTLGHLLSPLDIQFLPGATLDISGGTVTYANLV